MRMYEMTMSGNEELSEAKNALDSLARLSRSATTSSSSRSRSSSAAAKTNSGSKWPSNSFELLYILLFR